MQTNRGVDATRNSGKDYASIMRSLEVSASTLDRLQRQFRNRPDAERILLAPAVGC
jgi:hypothetical protein